MFQKITRITRQVYGVLEKEFLLRTRYPLAFFSSLFTIPLLSLIPLIFIFGGFLSSDNFSIYQIFYFLNADKDIIYYYFLIDFLESNISKTFNSRNYLPWILIGNIVYTFSRFGFNAFERRFMYEKFWGTVEGIILAPINKSVILFGFIFSILIESTLYFSIIITISYFIYPISVLQIFQIYLVACIMIIASGGIGLITGTITLANESFIPTFLFIEFTILFFSCFNIPIEFFPRFLQDFILINPYYHGTELARSIYFEIYTPTSIFSLIYIIIFAIIMSFIGILVSNKVWTKYGIHGY